MIFRQILRNESGCASYLLGCRRGGQAIVVDPLADVGVRSYTLEAADQGLRISYVIDTHIHADHRSAAQELARATGATLALPVNAPAEYPFHPLHDGDLIEAGGVRLQVIHTPGHTPESICLLGADTSRSEQPWFVLSGDTLFAGDVGRPDLLLDAEDAEALSVAQARMLYTSLFERLLKLDDIIEIYPGHFGGSACGGVNMSGKPASTIGFERRWNMALQQRDPEAFVRFVLQNLRPQPENYQRIKRDNLRLWRLEQQPYASQRRAAHGFTFARLAPSNAHAMLDEGIAIIDLRPPEDFAVAHAPGAISAPFSRADVVNSIAALLPAHIPLALAADNDLVADEAGGLLRDAGREVVGILAGGMATWWAAGLPATALDRWPIERLHTRIADSDLAVVDVREPHEWLGGVIPGARLIPQGQLWARRDELPRDRQIVTICAGGVRSARAASLLAYLGFPRVATVDRAGMADWFQRAYPTVPYKKA